MERRNSFSEQTGTETIASSCDDQDLLVKLCSFRLYVFFASGRPQVSFQHKYVCAVDIFNLQMKSFNCY